MLEFIRIVAVGYNCAASLNCSLCRHLSVSGGLFLLFYSISTTPRVPFAFDSSVSIQHTGFISNSESPFVLFLHSLLPSDHP